MSTEQTKETQTTETETETSGKTANFPGRQELMDTIHGLRKKITQLERGMETLMKEKASLEARLKSSIGHAGVKNPLVR